MKNDSKCLPPQVRLELVVLTDETVELAFEVGFHVSCDFTSLGVGDVVHENSAQ